MTVSTEPVAASMEFDFAEASPVAGRTMLTGIRGALRVTAVVDAAPRLRVGDKVHFVVPATPATLFAQSGERLS